MPLVDFNTTGEFSQTFNQVQAFKNEASSTAASIRSQITTVLDTIADGITTPVDVPTWGTLQGGTLLREDWGAAWAAPDAVTVPSVSPDAIALGEVGTPSAMATVTAPTWAETLPTEPGDAPAVSDLVIDAPGAISVATVNPTMPVAPTSNVAAFDATTMHDTSITLGSLPAAPTVANAYVEDLSNLVLPAFSVTVPTEDIGPLVAPFEFINERYVGRMNGRVETVLNRVLDGEPIIGADVFRALQDEAESDAATAYRDALQGAAVTAGMRGELPGESNLALIDAATGDYRKALQKSVTTFKIEAAKAWREDLWKGVDAANAYEAMWLGLHVQEIGRLLTVATATVQAASQVYNANIARWNAMLSQVSAHVTVSAENRARVLMQLEWHKEKLAQRELVLRASGLEIDKYQAEIQAYSASAAAQTGAFSEYTKLDQAMIEERKAEHAAALAVLAQDVQLYQAEVSAVNARLGIAAEQRAQQMLQLEHHKEKLATEVARLQAVDLKIKAWLGKWDGYKSAAQAKTTIFGAQVQAFGATVEQNKAAAGISVESVKAMIDKEQAITARIAADWDALTKQASAILSRTQALAVPAELQIKSETGRLAAEAQALQLVEQDVRASLEAGKAEAGLAIEYAKFREAMSTHDRDAILNALANMYGSVQAAAQVSLGASGGIDLSLSNNGSPCECQ